MKKALLLTVYIICAILYTARPAYAAISLVQVATSTNNNGGGTGHNMCNVQFPSNITAGDLVTVFNSSKIATSSVLSITDGTADSFLSAVSISSTAMSPGVDAEIWYPANSAGGTKSVTSTLAAQPSGAGFNCVAAEFSGVNALDTQAASTTTNLSGTRSSGSSTTSFAQELILGAFGTPNTIMALTSLQSGYTVVASSTSSRVFLQYATTTVAGVNSVSFTEAAGGGIGAMEMATFYQSIPASGESGAVCTMSGVTLRGVTIL